MTPDPFSGSFFWITGQESFPSLARVSELLIVTARPAVHRNRSPDETRSPGGVSATGSRQSGTILERTRPAHLAGSVVMLCGVTRTIEAARRPLVSRASHNTVLHRIEVMWSST